jgi:diguanylate cyclase (GGDEF)-like protein
VSRRNGILPAGTDPTKEDPMRNFPEKYRLLALLTGVLLVGFLTTSIASYIVSRDSIRQNIAQQALPLTGDNIYSEIQKDLLRPVFISSLMASDTFVRDWMLNGEADLSQITRYLNEVKKKYGTITSFLVSGKTGSYYYADGKLKTVDPAEPRDAWFYRVRDMRTPYETNVDIDMANRDTMTVFINYRVLDYNGNFIGATGVGLTLDSMTRLMDSYQSRFARSIYFVNPKGEVVLAGQSMKQVRAPLAQRPGIRDIAGAILNRSAKPTQLEYTLGGVTNLVNSRYVPELGWYLVVEQNTSNETGPVEKVFALNLAISAGVTLLVLALLLFSVNRVQGRLEQLAAVDPLTGLLNRQAFEIILRQSMLDVDRSGHPLSAILFDIDHFKQVNDTYGHLAGDKVLHAVAGLARNSVRENDIITRWGGEEFLILLRDCPLDIAVNVAEKLRLAIAGNDFGFAPPAVPVTISVGVAQYAIQETADSFFMRADHALYEAKAAGRNRTVMLMSNEQMAGAATDLAKRA